MISDVIKQIIKNDIKENDTIDMSIDECMDKVYKNYSDTISKNNDENIVIKKDLKH